VAIIRAAWRRAHLLLVGRWSGNSSITERLSRFLRLSAVRPDLHSLSTTVWRTTNEIGVVGTSEKHASVRIARFCLNWHTPTTITCRSQACYTTSTPSRFPPACQGDTDATGPTALRRTTALSTKPRNPKFGRESKA